MKKSLLALVLAACAVAAPITTTTYASSKKKTSSKIRKAWPKKGGTGKPDTALAQWLARQVGYKKPPKKSSKSKVKAAALTPVVTGPEGGPIRVDEPGDMSRLQLVRSFEIPSSDPLYARLLNLSFTYDSAIAAIAFINSGDKAQSEQLLDQLAALQRTDGSIDFAFDTYTGAGSGLFRTGTVAWVGLAAAMHDEVYGSVRYNRLATGVANWLTAQQLTSGLGVGLLTGGPGVTWASTQHNLVAYSFMNTYSKLLLSGRPDYTATDRLLGTRLQTASRTNSDAILRSLLISSGSDRYFIQGLSDTVRPLDVQTLGSMFLLSKSRNADATAVGNYMQRNYSVSDRSILLSTDPNSFNTAYEAAGPFIGFKPYADVDSPSILWAEGTYQARLALTKLAQPTGPLDESTRQWINITSDTKDGPLGSDKTVTNNRYNEYHVWPTSAAGSWLMISLNSKYELFKP